MRHYLFSFLALALTSACLLTSPREARAQTIVFFDDFNSPKCYGNCSVPNWTSTISTSQSPAKSFQRGPGGWSKSYNGSDYVTMGPTVHSYNNWYFSPAIQLTAGQKYAVAFYARHAQQVGGTDAFDIHFGSTASAGAMGTSASSVTLTGEYTRYSAVYTAAYTGTHYVGLHQVSDQYFDGFYMDDFRVVSLPPCSTVEFIAANPGIDQARLDWTLYPGELTQDYEVEYGPTGFAAGSGTTVSVTGALTTTLTGLTPGTAYEARVKTVCGGVGSQAVSAAFTTAFPASMPFVDNFDAPACGGLCDVPGWTSIPADPNLGFGRAAPNATDVAFDGTVHGQVTGRTGAHEVWAITPALDLVAGTTYRLKYRGVSHNAAGSPDRLDVYTGTNNLAEAMTTLVGTVTHHEDDVSPMEYREYTVDFVATGPAHIGLNIVGVGDFDSFFLDDFSVSDASCGPPTAVTAIPDVSTVALSWTSDVQSGSAAYQIEYGPKGFAVGSGTTVSGSGTSATVSGLATGTDYEFTVSTDCGGAFAPAQRLFARTSTPLPYATSLEVPRDENQAHIGWTLLGEEGEFTRYSPSARTGNNYFSINSMSSGEVFFVSPSLRTTPGQTYIIEAYIDRYDSHRNGVTRVEVVTGDGPAAAQLQTTHLVHDQDGRESNSPWKRLRVAFVAGQTASTYVAIKASIVSGNAGIRFDDFAVRELGPTATGAVATTSVGTCQTGTAPTTFAAQGMGFAPVNDAAGNLVAFVNANGNDLGAVTANAIDLGAVPTLPSGALALSRNVNLEAANGSGPYTANGGVKVAIPFTTAELAELSAAEGTTLTWSQVEITHYSDAAGATEDCDVSNNAVAGYSTLTVDEVLDYGPDAKLLVFQTTSFSEFGGAAAAPVPVTLTAFAASAKTRHNALAWTTAEELDFGYFAIERSADGVDFAEIARAAARGAGDYAFDDRDAAAVDAATVYYRLRAVDLDGSSERSRVVAVERGATAVATKVLRAYPNPAADVLAVEFVAGSAGETVLTVTDVAGREVLRHAQSVDTGLHTAVLDLSVLPKGAYQLRLTDASGATRVQPVMRQ